MVLTNTQVAEKQTKVLKFPQVNILEEGIEQVNRSLELKRGFFVENLTKEEVKIFFTDSTGLKEVAATHWALTDKAIVLKQSIVIPLAKIVAVA